MIIFMVPWEGVVKLPGLGVGGSSSAARYLGILIAGFWVLTVVLTGKLRIPSTFQIVFSLFVLWNAATVFWSKNPSRTVNHLVTWVQLFGLVYLFWDLYRTREDILTALQVFILGEYVTVGSAVYNFIAGSAFYSNYERFSAGDTNPDGFGFTLALGIPIAWYMASTKREIKFGKLFNILNYAIIPLILVGIALSGTRTALIGSAVGVMFGLASLSRLKLWVRVAVFVVITGGSFYALTNLQADRTLERFSTTGSELASGDLNGRLQLWSQGLEAFSETPLLGIGANMYRTINREYKVAHNTFISVLVETGVVGFALFMLLLLITISRIMVQPKWDLLFWLTLLMVWTIGCSTLTWEVRKSTWLILSLIVASSYIPIHRVEAVRSRLTQVLEVRTT